MRTSSVDQIILEILAGENAPLTSQQIYQQIRQRLPAVNHSTVYRALERLAVAGQGLRLGVGWPARAGQRRGGTPHPPPPGAGLGGRRGDEPLVGSGPHHHLVCQNCGSVQTIDHEMVGAFFRSLEQANQFKILTRHLVLFGVCQGCDHPQPADGSTK